MIEAHLTIWEYMKANDNGKEDVGTDYDSILHESLRRAVLGVTPIIVNTPLLVNKERPEWLGVGTGFAVTYQENVYLVTANHVLKQAFKNKAVLAKVFGKTVSLSGLYFADSEDFDLAVTLLPWKWLESYDIGNIYLPRLEPLPPVYEPTGEYHLAGFPASKNKMDLRWTKDRSTKVFTIEAKLDSRELSLSKIPHPIHLHYDPKAYGSNLPDLHGMSGGPLYEVMSRQIGNRRGLSLVPRGVLCEWHKESQVVVACSIESIIKLIEDRSVIWKLAADTHARSGPTIWVPPEPLQRYLPEDLPSPANGNAAKKAQLKSKKLSNE